MSAAPHHLTTGEGFVDPVGFHDPSPRFSWKLPDGVKRQTAYQLEVSNGSGDLTTGVWNSGWVESDRSVLVPYGGQPLKSREQAAWRVRFRDESGAESGWSDSARIEMGLLSYTEWTAQWIFPAEGFDPATEAVTYLRRGFSVNRRVERARLYVTARGLFEVHVNGRKVGNDTFTPGWTSYHHRLDTLTYDVTGMLLSGENALGVLLGTGWYSGRLVGWQPHWRNLYGSHPEVLVQLEIVYSDGTERIVSGGDWKATLSGPVRTSSIYDGEEYDARLEMPGWDNPGFDDSRWSGVAVRPVCGTVALTPKPFVPVRKTGELHPLSVTQPVPGRFVFDLGQNMVGWTALKMPVEEGRTVTLRFAEMLNPDGTPYTANYRSAKSTDTYTASVTGVAEWEPVFTFHGFRYVELSGLPGGAAPDLTWVKGVVLHSDLPRIGKFESSSELLNRLYSNMVWGQRGNFLEIPTDCPQRDERLGWTGDAQVFCPTAMFNYDCHAFFKSWLGTMRTEQTADGRIPFVIPVTGLGAGSPGWQDAAVIIPWEVYVRTGDTGVLADNFEMMQRLVSMYRNRAKDNLLPECDGFGDWLQPYAGELRGDTPLPLLGSAFYAYDAQLTANVADVLGRKDIAQQYAKEAEAIRTAFAQHYFNEDGKIWNAPETQTAYLLSIAFNLIPAGLQKKAAGHLVELVRAADGHLRTGFLGTPFIATVLDRMGYPDMALSVLFKETYPSWFYSIHQGATTMWERWNSYSHTNGFGEVSMNSFNHYAYGAIGQWMVERVAGLAPDSAYPGYKHFFIRPLVGGPLTSAKAELETPYGKASSAWEKSGGTVVMNIVVPPNTSATIEFPNGRSSETVSAGIYRFELEPE